MGPSHRQAAYWWLTPGAGKPPSPRIGNWAGRCVLPRRRPAHRAMAAAEIDGKRSHHLPPEAVDVPNDDPEMGPESGRVSSAMAKICF